METPGLLFREGGSSAQEFLCVTGEMGGKNKKFSKCIVQRGKKGVSQSPAAAPAVPAEKEVKDTSVQ